MVLGLGALLSCVACVGLGGWWFYSSKDKPVGAEKKDDPKVVNKDGDNKDGGQKPPGKKIETYTIVNLKERGQYDKRFDFTKGQRVLITVTNQLLRPNTDVDLFVFRGNNKNAFVWDDRVPQADPNCKVEFEAPATDSYNVRVLNLGPGSAPLRRGG